MPMFVDPNERVPVTVGENTVHIRAKMNAAITAKVNDEFSLIAGQNEGLGGMGSYSLALLVHNIVAWEGPDFTDAGGKPIPCTRANIERLDPVDPLVEAVREEIGKRNQRRRAPEGDGTADGAFPN